MANEAEAQVIATEEAFYATLRRLHDEADALPQLLSHWSQGSDVSTMNARGGVEQGSEAVRERWSWWASQGIAMEAQPIERLSCTVGRDLACTVLLEYHSNRTLRITHLYRREGETWLLVHRHADPLVGRQG
jgi:ketosteroid isomerase-like protein